MDIFVSVAISLLVLLLGALCALFPRRVVRIVCRHSSSYMKEDLNSDLLYVYMFRFYGLAAIGLGLYALYQALS